jgi:YD repeat-containing protein
VSFLDKICDTTFGRVVAIADALGHVTRLEYASDRGGDFWTPSRKVRSDGVTVEHRFDGRKAVAVTRDGEGRVTTYRFGPFDLLEEIVDAKGSSLRFGYDGEERLTDVTNPKGLRWSFTRDANGWVIWERDFDGIEQTYTYDAAGRLISSHHADGARFAYAYDKSDLLLSEEMQEPGGDVKITRYSYDYRGLLKEARNDWAHVE